VNEHHKTEGKDVPRHKEEQYFPVKGNHEINFYIHCLTEAGSGNFDRRHRTNIIHKVILETRMTRWGTVNANIKHKC
jgi:hypothetical protein